MVVGSDPVIAGKRPLTVTKVYQIDEGKNRRSLGTRYVVGSLVKSYI